MHHTAGKSIRRSTHMMGQTAWIALLSIGIGLQPPAFAETPLKPTIQKVLPGIDKTATPASEIGPRSKGQGIRPDEPTAAIALKQRHPKPSNLQHRPPRPAAPKTPKRLKTTRPGSMSRLLDKATDPGPKRQDHARLRQQAHHGPHQVHGGDHGTELYSHR